jgi:aryl-alcohol dehydrogenase-like predicted oxidoreductase
MRWDDETIERRASLVKKLKAITKANDLTPYAIQFVLSFKEITAVIPGIKTIEQLEDHLSYAAGEIDEKVKQAFIDLYENEIKDNPLPW